MHPAHQPLTHSTWPQPSRPAGLRLLVTDTPGTAGIPAVTPATAARLVTTGHAVAYLDETSGDPRQWLHLQPTPAARAARRAQLIEQPEQPEDDRSDSCSSSTADRGDAQADHVDVTDAAPLLAAVADMFAEDLLHPDPDHPDLVWVHKDRIEQLWERFKPLCAATGEPS